jgi:hypothetical protein
MSKLKQELNAAWLANFTPVEEPLPAPPAAVLAKIRKQFPKAKAGKRSSRNGVLHWYLIDPQLGPMAGALQ